VASYGDLFDLLDDFRNGLDRFHGLSCLGLLVADLLGDFVGRLGGLLGQLPWTSLGPRQSPCPLRGRAASMVASTPADWSIGDGVDHVDDLADCLGEVFKYS
jgi:hypothetical protein